ncbi:MAG: hypothetical protein SVK54_05455 [candidate division WOR-3 bacterium]|nr:hypothetical protein [candidate division WOR-3 bacterium]
MNRIPIPLIIAVLLISCTLFMQADREYEYKLYENDTYIDSFEAVSPGLYEFTFYSDEAVDVVFFNNREDAFLFADSGEVYSESIIYPFMFKSVVYFSEDVFIYDPAVMYFVVDNTDNLSAGSIETNIKIYAYYYKED